MTHDNPTGQTGQPDELCERSGTRLHQRRATGAATNAPQPFYNDNYNDVNGRKHCCPWHEAKYIPRLLAGLQHPACSGEIFQVISQVYSSAGLQHPACSGEIFGRYVKIFSKFFRKCPLEAGQFPKRPTHLLA